MATNLSIDQKLLVEALKISGHKTKKETVNEALREYIQRGKQTEITKIFVQIIYDKGYSYKALRHRK